MRQFDFEQIGKRMPYTVPDGFFDKLEANVMEEVRDKRGEAREYSSHKKALRIALRSILAVAACIILFFVLKPALPKNEAVDFESVELAFNNLSTEDQDYLLLVYEDEQDEYIYDLTIYDLQFNDEEE